MSVDVYSSAETMLAALAARDISAQELAELHIARIEAVDTDLNAIPVRTFDRTRVAAAAADVRLARGEAAPLLGLPMTLKESCRVAGLPQTAGIPDFAGYLPDGDGVVPAAVMRAGAGLLGKTNIPVALGDWQADSPVYGRTNNPWDLGRTPGGSTGGGGAALATGMTPLEVGSDIGGSVRVPATYCGVYGHRPSETAVPRSGAFPMADLPNPTFLLAVQGPLARTSRDLELLFDVMIGPDIDDEAGWTLTLPPARHDRLADFRVAVLPPLLDLPVAASLRGRQEELVALLGREGATVAEAGPAIDMNEYFEDYSRMLQCLISMGTPPDVRAEQAAGMRASGDPMAAAMAAGLELSAHDYLMLGTKRAVYRDAWRSFFRDWDVVLAPMTLDAAFPHTTAEQMTRTLTVDNVTVPYLMNIAYPMVSILAGLPSTAFPAGLNDHGLPLGLQAIGPDLEDRTTLKFVQLVEQAWRGFEAPPAYPASTRGGNDT